MAHGRDRLRTALNTPSKGSRINNTTTYIVNGGVWLEEEVAYSLWGNSTLGLITYWWHSSRQQAGRGSMPITAIRTMPTLDVTQLSDDQLQAAETIFDELKRLDFLPANEAYRDDTRKLLDRRVLIDLLNLPESILEPLDLLRLKWCSEPSVHGGKGTAPSTE